MNKSTPVVIAPLPNTAPQLVLEQVASLTSKMDDLKAGKLSLFLSENTNAFFDLLPEPKEIKYKS